MASPLTAQQETALSGGWTTLSDFEAVQLRPRQMQTRAEFVAAGLSGATIDNLAANGVRLEMTEYVTPSGATGWLLTARVDRNGRRWFRQLAAGPESYRAHGWVEVTVYAAGTRP